MERSSVSTIPTCLTPPDLRAVRAAMRALGADPAGRLHGLRLRVAAHFLIPLGADPGELEAEGDWLRWRGHRTVGATLESLAGLVRLAAEPGERWVDLGAGVEAWVRAEPLGDGWYATPPPGRGLRAQRCATGEDLAEFVDWTVCELSFGGVLHG